MAKAISRCRVLTTRCSTRAIAALLCRDVRRVRHSGVIAAFGQQLVKSGRFTIEHQRALQAGFGERAEGHYAGLFPSRESVERRLEEAPCFVESVADFLEAEGCLPTG